jgi:hypothetical protein
MQNYKVCYVTEMQLMRTAGYTAYKIKITTVRINADRSVMLNILIRKTMVRNLTGRRLF